MGIVFHGGGGGGAARARRRGGGGWPPSSISKRPGRSGPGGPARRPGGAVARPRLAFVCSLRGAGAAATLPPTTTQSTRPAVVYARFRGLGVPEIVLEPFPFAPALAAAGFLAMRAGQIIDASIVAAFEAAQHRGREATSRKAAFRRNGRRSRPSSRQKDRDARWTVKYTKAKPSADGAPRLISRSRLRREEPYRHRPPASPDPPLEGHRCSPPRWGLAARVDRSEQHRQPGVGRHRLSLRPTMKFLTGSAAALADPPAKPKGADASRAAPPGPMPASAVVRSAVEHVFACRVK